MTDQEKRFLELVKQKEELKDKLTEVSEALDAVMTELKVGSMLQDPETLLVFKVVKPTGKFTYYSDIDYVRTAKEGERAGTLSKKEAESMGYVLKK